MPFTGKATYSAGSDLPELVEDVSDIISIVSPYETPLLDLIGEPQRLAFSTVHEWLEDALLPNTDRINDDTITDPETETSFNVENGARFKIGDQLQVEGSAEVMLVVNISNNTLMIQRGYGQTVKESIADGQIIRILGGAAIEGDTKPTPRFTNRARKTNYTQIFTAAVEVSGSQLACPQIGLDDELDYQKQERIRELIRDLENCVINGAASSVEPEGSAATRRTMKGIIPFLVTNRFACGDSNLPLGDGPGFDQLNEEQINFTLRKIWEQSSGNIDTIVVGGAQKRRINNFITSNRSYDEKSSRFRDMVSVYESDFGVCRVVLSRWMPKDAVLFIDSSRIDVMPLRGRNFQFKKLAATGDSESGQIIGEYTLELRNENAHGMIRGLATS